MSAEFDATSWEDYRHKHQDAGRDDRLDGSADQLPTEDEIPGHWPEEVDVQYYAEGSLTLPGKGSSGKNCGVWFPKQFCGENGHVNLGRSQCNGRGCEGCWRLWAASSSRRIVRRLQAYRHAQANGLERRIIHAVVSPEQSPTTAKTLVQWYELVKQGYDVAKEAGVRGGVAIPHAWRVKTRVKRAWELHFKEATDGGIWTWIRENSQYWRDQVYYSPHVHIIGACEDFNDPDIDGWKAWRIRTAASYGLTNEDSYSDLLGLAYYQLSHSSYEPDEGKQVVRWFGDLAPASFSPPDEVSAGALDTIERYTEEVQYATGRATDDDESDTCEHCDSEDLHYIWHAREALQEQSFCERIGREQQKKLLTAYEYWKGDRDAPGGLRNPRTREDLEKILEVLG